MNFRFDEDPFDKNAQGVSKTYHEGLLLLKFLQTKPQVKNMIINYYDLYYTAFKNRDEKGNIDNQYEKDYINFDDIASNHNLSTKPRETTLRYRNLISHRNHFKNFSLFK